jgi:hypothetical protein
MMLTCIYHPIDDMRVVEEDEAERLMASGVWFDNPDKAQDYKLQVQDDIKKEKAEKSKSSKPTQKPGDKLI